MRPPWACRTFGHHPDWQQLGDTRVCQCARPRCRIVLAIVTRHVPPAGHGYGAIDALQHTDGRPADDWPGCID